MGDRQGPIYSSRLDDASLGDTIEAFVIGLAECIDSLQDAENKGDLPLVASLARTLIEDSSAAGYDSLSRCAAVIEAACGEEAPQEVRRAIVELTDIARRVRLGHRGAA